MFNALIQQQFFINIRFVGLDPNSAMINVAYLYCFGKIFVKVLTPYCRFQHANSGHTNSAMINVAYL